MSGDVINHQIQAFLTQHQKFCLSKPFSLDDFEAALNGLVPVS